jgi:hypothetical protein
MPDFSQPGKDGALPSGTPEWREGLGELTPRGLIYTGRNARSILAQCVQLNVVQFEIDAYTLALLHLQARLHERRQARPGSHQLISAGGQPSQFVLAARIAVHGLRCSSGRAFHLNRHFADRRIHAIGDRPGHRAGALPEGRQGN